MYRSKLLVCLYSSRGTRSLTGTCAKKRGNTVCITIYPIPHLLPHFKIMSMALQVIPIEGDFPVNDEPQKTFEEMLSEIVISKELSDLRDNTEHSTENFVQVKR